jgi:hypothetical protein
MKNAPNACQTSTALVAATGGILRYKDPGQAARVAQSLPDHVTVENGAGTTLVMSKADSAAFKELGWKVGKAVTEREKDSEYTANMGMDPGARMVARGAGARKPGWYVLDGDRIVAGPFDSDAKAMPSWKPGLKLKKLAGEGVTEGLKLVKAFSNDSQAAKVYKDSELDEYKVKFYKDGVHQTKADYHTDDKDDALQTAQSQIGLKESGPAQLTSGFQAGSTVMVPGRRLGTVVKANAVERTVTVELNGSKRKADYGYKELRKVKSDYQLPPETRDSQATSHFSDAKNETDARAPRDVPAKSLVQRMKDAEKSMMTARQQGRHTDAAEWRNKRDSLKAMIARRVAGAAPKAEANIRVSPEEIDSLWDRYAKAELSCKEAGDGATRGQRMASSRTLNAFRRACQASNLDPVREVARRMSLTVREGFANRQEAGTTPEDGMSKAAKMEGYEGPGWYVLNGNGDILSPQFDFQSDAQTFQDEHLPAGDTYVSQVDDAGEPMSESTGHVVRMSSGAYVIADSPVLGPDTKVRADTGDWIPMSGLVHGSDWDGIKFPDEASAQAELGEAGANYPSPEAYGRFGAAEDGSVISNPSGFARLKGSEKPAMEAGAAPKFKIGDRVWWKFDPAHKQVYRGVVDTVYPNGSPQHRGEVCYSITSPGGGRYLGVPESRMIEPPVDGGNSLRWRSPTLNPDQPPGWVPTKVEGRKVQSKFAGAEVDLDRWYIISDAARFLTPDSFASKEEALAWVQANPDGVDLEDGDAVIKGSEFVEIYDESYPAGPSSPEPQLADEDSKIQRFSDKGEFRKAAEASVPAEDLPHLRWDLLGNTEYLQAKPYGKDKSRKGRIWAIGAGAESQSGLIVAQFDPTGGLTFEDMKKLNATWQSEWEAGQSATTEASDASFKKWLKKNRNNVVVGTVESDYGTTWLVGSKETGWGFLDIVGYWSEETGPEFSADMSPMEDSDVILEPDQEIEHSDVDALLAAMDGE